MAFYSVCTCFSVTFDVVLQLLHLLCCFRTRL